MAYTGSKKFSKKVGNRTVRYGAKGYTVKAGTKAGDNYCNRSAGQMKKHPKAVKPAAQPTALRALKLLWKGRSLLFETIE